jgi:hypothetical protein
MGPTGSSAGNIPVGGIIMWSGASMPAPNWALCDGFNGTPNLTNQFILGAGTLPIGSTGGSSSITIANLPSHTHTISSSDNGHSHGVNDPTHGHGVTDQGHSHALLIYNGYGGTTSSATNNFQPLDGNNSNPVLNSANNGVNGSNISIVGAPTGVTLQTGYASISSTASNTGSNTPYMPPYYVLAFIMRMS